MPTSNGYLGALARPRLRVLGFRGNPDRPLTVVAERCTAPGYDITCLPGFPRPLLLRLVKDVMAGVTSALTPSSAPDDVVGHWL